jgi:uncharacterized protein
VDHGALGDNAECVTRENLELARRGYEAFRSGSLEAVLDLLDPEIVWSEGTDVPEPEVYRGHEGVRRQHEQFKAAWESFRIVPEDFIDAGDRTVVIVRIWARGRGSGAEVEARAAHVWTARDGKATRLEMYMDPSKALRAVGLPGDLRSSSA